MDDDLDVYSNYSPMHTIHEEVTSYVDDTMTEPFLE